MFYLILKGIAFIVASGAIFSEHFQDNKIIRKLASFVALFAGILFFIDFIPKVYNFFHTPTFKIGNLSYKEISSKKYTFDNAKLYCGKEWRLPTKNELSTIIDKSNFKLSKEIHLWSYSPPPRDVSWAINLSNYNWYESNLEWEHHVICVKNSPL